MPDLAPTQEDPLLAENAELIGGPAGRHRRLAHLWWTPVRVLIVLAALAYCLGVWIGSACRGSGWTSPESYEHLCYTDIHPLYTLQGLADGLFPYSSGAQPGHGVDAPVLVGMLMELSARITQLIAGVRAGTDAAQLFFDVNVVLLLVPLLVIVVATALTARNRPWDAAMVALAPMMILASRISWELLAVALVAVALLLWSRGRLVAAGLLLGAAMASAHFPLMILLAVALLALRTRQWSAAARIMLPAVLVWLVVNLPFMLLSPEGWSAIYRTVVDSTASLGSLWYAWALWGGPQLSAQAVTIASLLLLLAALAGIAGVVLRAPVPARAASVVFLVVAASLLTAKGIAPQFGIILVPLAVLARPRWRDFLIWQGTQVATFVAVWWYLAGSHTQDAKGLPPEWYALAVLVSIAGTSWLCAMVVRDILRPDQDPVRLTSPDPGPDRSAMW